MNNNNNNNMNNNNNTDNNHNHGQNNNKPIDMMTLSHLLMWITFGYCFPNYYLYALLLSILWELFEYMLVRVNIFYVLIILN